MVLHLNAAFSIELELFGANPAIRDCTGLALINLLQDDGKN